jgi:hypothetical protein
MLKLPSSWNDVVSATASVCSSSLKLLDLSFENYCQAIDRYPADAFDLVVVDGRARPSCVFHARSRVRPGGYLMVDDAERPEYAEGLQLLEGWPRTDFSGPVPFNMWFGSTACFARPGSA